MIRLINELRASNGLYAYRSDSRLTNAARTYSIDMGCNGASGHIGSDGSTARDRIIAAGYTPSWWGENIYWGGSTAQQAFNWWINSEPHLKNILHSRYLDIGVGVVFLQGSSRGYFTINFGRP